MATALQDVTLEQLLSKTFSSMGPCEADILFTMPVRGQDIVDAVRESTGDEYRCYSGNEGLSPVLVGSVSHFPGENTGVLALTAQGPSLISPDEMYQSIVVKGVNPRNGIKTFNVGGDPLARQHEAVHKLAEKLDAKFGM